MAVCRNIFGKICGKEGRSEAMFRNISVQIS